MEREHIKMKRVAVTTLKLLETQIFKKIKANISKDMIIKQGLHFENYSAGQKASDYFCSQKTFSYQFTSLCDCCLGPTEGVEFF